MNLTDFWLVTFFSGLGTYLLRFSFIGLIGSRQLPDWVMRHLRYVPVAVMPALIAPLVAWPAATGGHPDPARLSAAAVALFIGAYFKSVIGSIIGGMTTLYLALYFIG